MIESRSTLDRNDFVRFASLYAFEVLEMTNKNTRCTIYIYKKLKDIHIKEALIKCCF